MSMPRYSDPEIKQDSALATLARADLLVAVAMFETGGGTRAIMTSAAQSSVSPGPGIPDLVFAHAAHLVRITASRVRVVTTDRTSYFLPLPPILTRPARCLEFLREGRAQSGIGLAQNFDAT
jgi:hypothetical protein